MNDKIPTILALCQPLMSMLRYRSNNSNEKDVRVVQYNMYDLIFTLAWNI